MREKGTGEFLSFGPVYTVEGISNQSELNLIR
jgi:hypothetical protein